MLWTWPLAHLVDVLLGQLDNQLFVLNGESLA